MERLKPSMRRWGKHQRGMEGGSGFVVVRIASRLDLYGNIREGEN